MGLEPRSSNFSNSRKDDWDWEGGGAGREAEREGKWAYGRICGCLRQSEAGESKASHDAPSHHLWFLRAVSCVLAKSWAKFGNHWFKEQLRGILSRSLFL